MQLYFRKDLVDDDLVDSVVLPTQEPGALGVCRAVLANMFSVERLDTMLNRLTQAAAMQGRKIPLLVLWGDADPWMSATTPDHIQAHYEPVNVTRLPDAGHCPQDDSHEKVNEGVVRFIEDLQVQAQVRRRRKLTR